MPKYTMLFFLALLTIARTQDNDTVALAIDEENLNADSEPKVEELENPLAIIKGRFADGSETGEECLISFSASELKLSYLPQILPFEPGVGIDFAPTTDSTEIMMMWGTDANNGQKMPMSFVQIEGDMDEFIDSLTANLATAELDWDALPTEPLAGILRRAAMTPSLLEKMLAVIPEGSPILNACGVKGRNALHQALMEAPEKYVATSAASLVKHGADMSAFVRGECPANKAGYTPLMIAATRAGEQYVDFLKALEPEDVCGAVDLRLCNPKNDFEGFTAIEMAVDEFRQKITEELMRLGADAKLAVQRIEEHKTTIQSVYHEMFGQEEIPAPAQGCWTNKDTIWFAITSLAFTFGAILMAYIYKEKKTQSEKQIPEIVIEERESESEKPRWIKVSKRKISSRK